MSLTEIVRKFVGADGGSQDQSKPVVILEDDCDPVDLEIRKLVKDFYDKSPSVLRILYDKYPTRPWPSNSIGRKLLESKSFYLTSQSATYIVKLPDSLKPANEVRDVYLADQFYSLKDIEENFDAKWDWNMVSSLSCLTSEFVHKHINMPWNWSKLSSNYSLDVWLAVKNPTLPWDWRLISSCWATPQDIEEYPDLPWDWNMLSGSPFMDVEFFDRYIDKINFVTLSYNRFLSGYLCARKAFYRDLAKRRRELECHVSEVTGSDVASVIGLYYL